VLPSAATVAEQQFAPKHAAERARHESRLAGEALVKDHEAPMGRRTRRSYSTVAASRPRTPNASRTERTANGESREPVSMDMCVTA
jgi:hypothetical protein